MHHPKFKNKSWQQILQEVAYWFNDDAFEVPVTEYLEAFDYFTKKDI